MMRTEFLTDWEILALLESVEKNETLDPVSKHALVTKLEKSTHVRVSRTEVKHGEASL